MNKDLDQHWSGYYAQNKDFRLITSQVLSKILVHVDDTLSKTCLDIGCGTGQLTRELYHRGYQCTGIDSSSKAIELARSNALTPELNYLHFDIEKDDIAALPGAPYSLVTCKLVIAFIQDKDTFLRKAKQLLTAGGSLVIITPTHTSETEATPISVNCTETLQLINKHFESISSFELDNLSCFIAK